MGADLERRDAAGDPGGGSRHVALDALRGVAVVLMVSWHTASSWLALEHRDGSAWDAGRVIGGLGAPLFLFVAGAAVALGAQRGRSIVDVARRGAFVVVLGFALRLFLWAIDSRAVAKLESWPVILTGALACGLALFGLRRAGRAWALALAAVLAVGYVACAVVLAETATRRLFNFDVLHAIGISTVVVALALRWWGRARAGWALLALLAFALAASTRPIGDALAMYSGPWLAWIARPNELGAYAAFPLLPWCAYAFAGAAAALAPRPKRHSLVFALAVAVAFVTYEGGFLWSDSLLGTSAWMRPLGRLVFYASCALGLAVIVANLRFGSRTLVLLGQLSLAIYCLHLELVFGLVARPLVRRLDPTEWAVATSILVIGTFIAAHTFSRLRARPRSSQGGAPGLPA